VELFRWGVFVSGLLLSLQPVRAAAITIEGDAPLKSITITMEGATLTSVVRELSQKYGFEVQGLDDMKSPEPLSATMSGSLQSILEGLLQDCNHMLVRSADNKSGVEKIIIVNCTRGSAPSLGEAQNQLTETPQQRPLDAGQLDQLIAPIALYADPLLAQILMASTYPLEVAQADRFAKANKNIKGDKLKEALAKQDWDASIKELVSTPSVLAMMSDKLDWTEKLGDAVLAEQADVMDAIQRLRAKAQANGKLETTKQQTVRVTQEVGQQVIQIEPTSPDVVYVPYYDPAVVYGDWPYPEYPPYYYPPPAGYIVGGAIATGVAWGIAYAIRRELRDDIDWDRGDINLDINRDSKKWEHDSYHRRGVQYANDAVRNKFAKVDIQAADRRLDYRGRSGEQVSKPGKGDGHASLGDRADGGTRPNIGQIQQALAVKAFDPSEGRKAKDFSQRGRASLGNRSVQQLSRPAAGVPTTVRRSVPQYSRPAAGVPTAVRRGGGGNISRGGGRRSDIRLKQDIVPLVRLNNGLELYRFRYKGSDHIAYVGVMAQEVQKIDPNAVWRDHAGYLMVNYDLIGLKLMTWKEWLTLDLRHDSRQR
jgi:hypothetical protein